MDQSEVMKFNAISQKVSSLLQGLENPPEDIAIFLEGQGIKGVPFDGGMCPMAAYIKNNIPGVNLVVTDTCVKFFDGEGHLLSDILFSQHVREFILLFDMGRFPRLDTPDADTMRTSRDRGHLVECARLKLDVFPDGFTMILSDRKL